MNACQASLRQACLSKPVVARLVASARSQAVVSGATCIHGTSSAASASTPGRLARAAPLAVAAVAGASGASSLLPVQSFCSADFRLRAASGDASDAAVQSAPVQYSLLRIAGDGRCLFRSLAQGSHIAAQQDSMAAADAGGTQSGSSSIRLLGQQAETERADELRQAVCQELLKRRDELCFFVDEDYDAYVQQMRMAHTWGGEPELAVAAHVLGRPIAVFSQRAGQLSLVSKYGDGEYTERQEVPVFFHGAGHYDLLVPTALLQQAAAEKRSRL